MAESPQYVPHEDSSAFEAVTARILLSAFRSGNMEPLSQASM
eukprot:CAMPEP_0181445974 /NCGR_PEP_ID=MMETSP1110-20121109/25865_1 /TAXON_ID=174948 /ORGANISM="Symbiodinium sp., Strain CCMP421" /LENGTH=41 /DNA_ID= /DNA_START= /DNA_END= /DNA_ORIENTATION=